MVNDVTSPVAASRYYAYISLAAYESQSVFNDNQHPSFSGYLKGYHRISIDSSILKRADPKLAILLAIFKAGQKLLPSGYLLKKEIDSLKNLYSNDTSQVIQFNQTDKLTDLVVSNIIQYAKADGFGKLNNLPRYIVKEGDGFWKPTPPVFMAPVEPHWNTIRTFILDSAQQFKAKPPVPYDTAHNSDFYKLIQEVYDVQNNASKSQIDIALFWDCNPFAVQQIGHVEFGLKKISPGGHWMGIAGIACKKRNLSMANTAFVHVLVSLSVADAFIACWDEKYRSNRVRPETAIQQFIQKDWHPLLQTPPFPEYVSGHSVASTAAAISLTKIFGDNFAYVDNSEVEFGLSERKYKSFINAASEAAISRLYGGIHYNDAIDQGVWQGRKVGEFSILRLESYYEKLNKNILQH
jgi:hypothetical protein